MDLEADEARDGAGSTDGGEQPAASPDAPTKEERLDFLRQAIAFTEWTIRSFDTKAQISIAAFVLSMNPSVVDPDRRMSAGGLELDQSRCCCVLFVATVLLFGFVIWPVTLTQSKLTGGWQTKGLVLRRGPEPVDRQLVHGPPEGSDDRGSSWPPKRSSWPIFERSRAAASSTP